MTDETDPSHTICHFQKPLPQRDLSIKMTDDRVCCENIAGGNVCNCERDEGGPLVTVLQEMVANQCMLLC